MSYLKTEMIQQRHEIDKKNHLLSAISNKTKSVQVTGQGTVQKVN